MTDIEQITEILDRAHQPHFEYTQVGEGGNFKIMVLDDHRDEDRIVPLLFFDLQSKMLVGAGTRYLSP